MQVERFMQMKTYVEFQCTEQIQQGLLVSAIRETLACVFLCPPLGLGSLESRV